MARNSYSHNTRGAAKNNLQLSSANNKFELKTFACQDPELWNDLPSELLEIESLLKFKTLIPVAPGGNIIIIKILLTD